jgi:hypothetical protein
MPALPLLRAFYTRHPGSSLAKNRGLIPGLREFLKAGVTGSQLVQGLNTNGRSGGQQFEDRS